MQDFLQNLEEAVLTVQFDAQQIGRPAEGHPSHCGGAWHGRGAEEHVGRGRLVKVKGRITLAAVDALV